MFFPCLNPVHRHGTAIQVAADVEGMTRLRANQDHTRRQAPGDKRRNSPNAAAPTQVCTRVRGSSCSWRFLRSPGRPTPPRPPRRGLRTPFPCSPPTRSPRARRPARGPRAAHQVDPTVPGLELGVEEVDSATSAYAQALASLAEAVAHASPATVPSTLAAIWTNTSEARMTVVLSALAQVGTPYRYAGAAPGVFDCSGLVQWSWSQVGVSLPRVGSLTNNRYRSPQVLRVESGRHRVPQEPRVDVSRGRQRHCQRAGNGQASRGARLGPPDTKVR